MKSAVAKLALWGWVLLVAAPASAVILPVDGNAMPGWQGTRLFQDSFYTFQLSANVDFAVYEPGAFDITFGIGADPSGGAEYVYAYQIHNHLTDTSTISALTVGLDGDTNPLRPPEPLTNGPPLGYVSFLDDVLFSDFGLDPSDSRAVPPGGSPPPTSMRWDFVDGLPTLLPGMSSDILLFTCPALPEWDSGTLDAAWAATEDLPSPSPEPTTVVILAAGGLIVLRRRKA